jgi:uncharacterized protein (TIGR04255 family)
MVNVRSQKGGAKGVRANMPFPEAVRVLYKQNPIEIAICQLRFPPILRIDAEPPAQFQDLVRAIYPYYQLKPFLPAMAGMPSELANLFPQGLPFAQSERSHEFMDKSKQWTVTLSRESLALTCTKYERWEQFKRFLEPPLAALRQLYSPPFFVRLGLRYRDVIRRDRLGLRNEPWKDLLEPWIAGPYGSLDVENDIVRTAHQILIRLSDGNGSVLVNHGLAEDANTKEWCYVIDSDFSYEDQTEDADVAHRLDLLKGEAGRFFRWCIRERLHCAMEPGPLSAS